MSSNQPEQKTPQNQEGHYEREETEKKRMSHGQPVLSTRRALVLLLFLLIVAAVLAVTGILPRIHARSTLAAQTNALAAPTVLVAKPGIGVTQEEVILPGNLQAYIDSAIYARTSGYLEKWYFDIGARVKKGQLLAVIASPEVDQELAQAKADLATAEANARNANVQSARYQDLVKSDAVSKQDTDNFATQALAGNTTVKSATANVQRLQQLVDFEKVYAPFDGVVTARNTDIGSLINAGSGALPELFHMGQIDTLRTYVSVPQIYTPALHRGMTADLTFNEYPGKRFSAKLVRTADQIDPVSRTLLVEFDLENRKGEILPGAYTQVHFKPHVEHPTYIIPVSALMFRSEGLRVGTVVGGKARMVPIIIGQDDGRTVQVVEGLNADSEVIQDPPDSLIDGEVVQVTQPPPMRPAESGSQNGKTQGSSMGSQRPGSEKKQ